MGYELLSKALFGLPEERSQYLPLLLADIGSNQASRADVLAAVASLGAKKLNVDDVVIFIRYLESLSALVDLETSKNTVNIVGTGGAMNSFNVSTAAALVAGAAGATVLKSGSSSYNSKSGSLDVIKALKIQTATSKQRIENELEQAGVSFMGPELYNRYLLKVAIRLLPVELKNVGGFLNKVGPLLCPFNIHGQVTGVASKRDFIVMSEAFVNLGRSNCLLVHSSYQMDELCPLGVNDVVHIRADGTAVVSTIEGRKFGFEKCSIGDIQGGSPASNAKLITRILSGDRGGAAEAIVVMNAAALLWVAEEVPDFGAGVELAQSTIRNGVAVRKLESLRHVSQPNRDLLQSAS